MWRHSFKRHINLHITSLSICIQAVKSMGRSVLCEESLLQQLEQLSNKKGFTPGLILGQFTSQKDYVIHLPQTPMVSEDNVISGDPVLQENSFIKYEDINDNLISDHARAVTRMLPGGMWVLGFFVAGPTDIFGDKNGLSKIRSIGNAVYNCTKGNEYLCGKDTSNQLLVLYFNSLSRKFTCKVLEMNSINSSLRPADWKFKSNPTTWLTVNCNINLNWLGPFIISSETQSTKKKLQEWLKQFEEYINRLVPIINGANFPPDKNLAEIREGQNKLNQEINNEDDKNDVFLVKFFSTLAQPEIMKKSYNSYVTYKVEGWLNSKVFLNEKSTAEDALKAVKDDLMRSLAARLEMHWQTFEESEEHNSITLTRVPPRRVLFTPEDWRISFSEYLFEGESEEDARASITENLGLTAGNIVAIENVWKISNENASNCQKSKTGTGQVDSNKKSTKKPKNEILSNNFLLIGLVAAGLTLILSIFLQFMY